METDTISFEDAFARLEATVSQLEGSGLSIDDLVARFEEGMRLVRLCHDRLNAAQARLTVLVHEGEGYEATDFE